ncbi:unnamed protein product [Clonostachys rosea]|uniref:Uncharacterized protein n=1 Tax=Bionectria ochroleuca TaxID=29856 RepID=A0ABY6UMB4_BIOOC|nr:unnamed protein product [Clonostachys rosea]
MAAERRPEDDQTAAVSSGFALSVWVYGDGATIPRITLAYFLLGSRPATWVAKAHRLSWNTEMPD